MTPRWLLWSFLEWLFWIAILNLTASGAWEKSLTESDGNLSFSVRHWAKLQQDHRCDEGTKISHTLPLCGLAKSLSWCHSFIHSFIHPPIKQCPTTHQRARFDARAKHQRQTYSLSWDDTITLVCSCGNKSTGPAHVPHHPRAELCQEARSSNTCLLLFSQYQTCGCSACRPSDGDRCAVGRFETSQVLPLSAFLSLLLFSSDLKIFQWRSQILTTVYHMQDMQMPIFDSLVSSHRFSLA